MSWTRIEATREPACLGTLRAWHLSIPVGESSEPMNARELITAMEAKSYWSSPGGKAPHATLYSANLRDLAKGDESRFVKTERGRFTVRGYHADPRRPVRFRQELWC